MAEDVGVLAAGVGQGVGENGQSGEAFVDGNGRYQPGSLFTAVADLPESDPLFTDALNATEQVLPTRWRN